MRTLHCQRAVWAWLAEYAAFLLNRQEVGKDGKTIRRSFGGEGSAELPKEADEILKSSQKNIAEIRKQAEALRSRAGRSTKSRVRIESGRGVEEPGKPGGAVPPANGKKLGFYIGEMAPSVREYLGLKDGRGLMVDRVEPGSLAQRMDLRAQDIVLKVAGVSVRGPEDVRRGLESVADQAEVAVQILRRGRPMTLRQGHEVPKGKAGSKRLPLKKR